MADTKLTALTSLGETPATGDLAYIVDVSDTTDGASGTSKKITRANLVGGLAGSGANSDITSLTSLSTPLTVAQGGSGAATLSGILKGNGTSAFTAVSAPTGTIVGTSDSQTLTNKTLTAPIIATISNTGTLTLPTSTDTLVGKATTDTLTNKTLTSPSMTTPSVTSGDLNLATGLNIQVNSADPKRGLYVPASAMYPSTTAGCAALAQVESTTNDVNIKVLDFDGAGTSKEAAEFGIQSPTWWDASTLTVQFIWYATAGSGTVNWEAQAVAFSDDDALDAAYGTLQEVTDTLLATGDVHITAETAAITVAGTPVAGDWINVRINRDPANDTNTSDARLMGVRVRFGMSQYNDA